MEIRLERSAFQTELALMLGIVERKTTIPVLSHILLTARGDKLHLAATDLDVSLTSSCEAEVAAEGAIAVQAKKLTEIVRAVAGDEVRLALEEPEWLTIAAGNSRFKIHGLSPEDFPTLPVVEAAEGASLPYDAFKRMIGKILFAVSAEESRFQLNGALMKVKQGGLELVATDGYRLALVEGTFEGVEGGNEDGVLVPRKALQELQRFEADGDVTYQRGQHHLSFGLGGRELICRILEGTYPDYERVISRDNEKKVVFGRRELTDAVRRVALLTGDRARAVRFAFTGGGLTISAANPDLGEAREELPCEYSGGDFQVGINPDFIVDFLAAVETDQVRLELKDENSQAVGCPVDGPDTRYLCVIMPMRI